MSRLLAQPIYRDAVLFGKFLGSLLVVAIALLALWLLMTGLGILFLGLPPSTADIVRGIAYLGVTLAYTGVWLALAIMFSTVIRSPATSALAALSVWLVLTVFWSMISPLLAGVFAPLNPLDPMSIINQYETQQAIARLSPQTLYGEVTAILLDPSARSVGPLFVDQMQGAIVGAPLPTIQSLIVVWPQIAGLISAMILLFTLGYVVFQRQEVRA
jgi:ABC-2 type transport system permease protein